ncbi:MAG: hypothetical protein KBA31_08775 [Alphaproteobacteria bacterium]|nr:hypothetical protein [Alphaproteobacteria bacterium]
MDGTSDTLVLDTAWEIQEDDIRFEPRAHTPQQRGPNGEIPYYDIRAAHQAVPAPSLGEKWIADAIRWVSAKVRGDGHR